MTLPGNEYIDYQSNASTAPALLSSPEHRVATPVPRKSLIINHLQKEAFLVCTGQAIRNGKISYVVRISAWPIIQKASTQVLTYEDQSMHRLSLKWPKVG